MSSASPRSRTPSSIALSTMPIGWNWTGRPCANSKPPSRPKLMPDHPRRKPPGPYLRQPSQQKGIRDDRRAQLPARPGGSTGTSRARRCASREGAPRHARVPPIDYRDGLSPCLTSHQETDITTIIQRRRQRPRNTGRNRSEQLVAIVGIPTLSFPPKVGRELGEANLRCRMVALLAKVEAYRLLTAYGRGFTVPAFAVSPS